MKNTVLTYGQVRVVKPGISNEKLVGVRTYDRSIAAKYDKYDMIPYTGFTLLVRDTIARKLAGVNKNLQTKYRLGIKVAYGYRAPEVQTRYFNEIAQKLRKDSPGMSDEDLASLAHNFVAVPDVAGHITGGAVDLTLIDAKGEECDMGTKIADFSNAKRIRTFDKSIDAAQQRLRQLLLDEMTAEGFAPFLGEWWHFSYGDKEWAAYYRQPRATYGPVAMEKTAKVYQIAGGNETVIQIIRGKKCQGSLEQAGRVLLDAYPKAEQAGFLYLEDKKLEMAGGEFCGNACAAAGLALLAHLSTPKVRYSVSGFEDEVTAEITPTGGRVRISFTGMAFSLQKVTYGGKRLDVVDMKGIIHILIEDDFPVANYKTIQRDIIDKLGLRNRDAVGVIWYAQTAKEVQVYPVVWVRKVDTTFYESACGSGAIATSIATGIEKIRQPTGEYINVSIVEDCIVTESHVSVT
jgi:D-alanyl-D-alanine dipeptidase